MKTKLNLNKVITYIFTLVFLLNLSSVLIAQEKELSDLKDFKFLIERTEEGIKMQSIRGTAWIDLSFRLKNDKTQAIDEYGMLKLKRFTFFKGSKTLELLFTISKTEHNIILKGIKGTAWTELSFPLSKNEIQAIDQFGMAEED